MTIREKRGIQWDRSQIGCQEGCGDHREEERIKNDRCHDDYDGKRNPMG